jgi:hypothetical protein
MPRCVPDPSPTHSSHIKTTCEIAFRKALIVAIWQMIIDPPAVKFGIVLITDRLQYAIVRQAAVDV